MNAFVFSEHYSTHFSKDCLRVRSFNVSADHFWSMQKDPNGDLLLHVRDLLQAVDVVDVSAVHSLPPGPRGEESWVRVVSVPLDVLEQLLGHSGTHNRLSAVTVVPDSSDPPEDLDDAAHHAHDDDRLPPHPHLGFGCGILYLNLSIFCVKF